jgi:hypothetical protein
MATITPPVTTYVDRNFIHDMAEKISNMSDIVRAVMIRSILNHIVQNEGLIFIVSLADLMTKMDEK